jgi:hypothetical protein
MVTPDVVDDITSSRQTCHPGAGKRFLHSAGNNAADLRSKYRALLLNHSKLSRSRRLGSMRPRHLPPMSAVDDVTKAKLLPSPLDDGSALRFLEPRSTT